MTNDEAKGMLFAIQASLRALMASHPDPEALGKAFEVERKATLAHLLEKLAPVEAVRGFRSFMDGVVSEHESRTASQKLQSP